MLTTQPHTNTKPTIDDVRSGLSKALLDDFETAWAEICNQAGIAPDRHDIDDATFDQLLRTLSGRDPLCRVLAMSWRIRRTAFQKLEQIGRNQSR